MKTYNFAIIASGLDPEMDGFEDLFFEAGCDDATISFQKGAIIVEFSREAVTFSAAVISAYTAVLCAGAKVERFEPDHLVSLADIASRTGLTRSALSHYASGARAANFPAPVARVTSDSPLWDWCAVSEWMCVNKKTDRTDMEVVIQARLVKEANLVVEASGLSRDHFIERLTSRAAELEAVT